MVDKGTEFRGEVIFLANKYNVKIYIARNKESMGIIERFNRSFEEYIYRIQDAVEMRLSPGERCRDWIDNAPIFLKQYDNSVNRMIGMFPAEARKKKHVYRLASKPRKGPIGFDEEKLPFHVSVRYLLKPGELEGGRRRATDMNWSPQIYRIKERLVQKNQPILYWIIDDNEYSPERSFVREQLLIIPYNTELPPQWVLKS